MRFVMVLKDEGEGEFKMEHVDRLARQIDAHTSKPHAHEFIVLSNLEWPNPERARLLPLVHGLPGWWSMMEMYRIQGPAIYMDLDMAIAGSLDPLVNRVRAMSTDQIMFLRKFRPVQPPYQTGITCWNGDNRQILTDFLADVKAGQFDPWMRRGRLLRAGPLRTGKKKWDSDEHWLHEYVPMHDRTILALQDELPGGYVQSYKRHLNYGCEPATGAIVVFHGTPRPWEVEW